MMPLKMAHTIRSDVDKFLSCDFIKVGSFVAGVKLRIKFGRLGGYLFDMRR